MPESPPPASAQRSTAKRAHVRGRLLGRLGEELAAAHFRELGFTVLARNARSRHGEIDLIACNEDVMVFAEVKTRRVAAGIRRPRSHQEPLAWLRARQRARLRKLAIAWLADPANVRPWARAIRFDAIGVSVDSSTGQLARLDHIEGAW
jgi:putative endonuclease